jgi:hypothetical protein
MKKLTYEFVRNNFEENGYVLLSKEYRNSRTKLYYTCSKGHKHSIKWNDWKEKHRCPSCSGNAKLTLDRIKKSFEQEDYILLSEEYEGAFTKLDYICPKGHKHSIIWNSWQQSRRCPICKSIKLSGSGSPFWKGGISYEPYCAMWKDEEYKQDIKERDKNRCLNPCCDSKKPNDLTIHHIDYNKKNCHPTNLITVCRSCNSRANKDRDWHQTWYQAIIKNRYGGMK